MMTRNLVFFAFLWSILNCSCGQKKGATDNTAATHGKNSIDTDLAFADSLAGIALPTGSQDTIGPAISTIDIFLKAVTKEEKQYAQNGLIGGISIDKPEQSLPNLVNPNEMILPYAKVVVVADYPLNRPANFELTTKKGGFSRKEMIEHVSSIYHSIYRKEEASAKTKTVPAEKREGLINRNETDGEYGIWGHDISDLYLSYIEVHRSSAGVIYLILGIDS
ncbi:hypothetical protein [Filimonas effusa]|uniref:Uncharacterized protein n=1 Tax=Filimonas effusa TaxID=2508721 RepID=A0A4V1MAT0_9BACT|nr:hypothetical protein [Filimonas effusa]RXK86946.1 hypothetical protein ESB13_09220 [Filimonas effusa]